MEQRSGGKMNWWERLKLALGLIFGGLRGQRVIEGLRLLEARERAGEQPPEWQHASALMLLGAFQREGRLIDFLEQEIAGFSDAEVGSAARVVHEGCRKVLRQNFHLASVYGEPEGGRVTVEEGFDAQRVRLSGEVSGKPPYRGTLKHPGWQAKEVKLPTLQEGMDPRVVAPAEVEVGGGG